jgi:hypothetical protein
MASAAQPGCRGRRAYLTGGDLNSMLESGALILHVGGAWSLASVMSCTTQCYVLCGLHVHGACARIPQVV